MLKNSLYDPKSPPRGLSKIGLSEKRFPLKTRHEVPSISELWVRTAVRKRTFLLAGGCRHCASRTKSAGSEPAFWVT